MLENQLVLFIKSFLGNVSPLRVCQTFVMLKEMLQIGPVFTAHQGYQTLQLNGDTS